MNQIHSRCRLYRGGTILVKKILLSIALLVLTRAVAIAQWPEFRGPLAQGHSAEKGLPLEWNESKNIAWKVPVAGLGWSTPVIANGRVWLARPLACPPR